MKFNALPKDNVIGNVVKDIKGDLIKKEKVRKKYVGERNYYVHSTTKNKSFLKMKKLLMALGLETNNDFFLALYNPKLKDIDPFDENLGRDQQLWVLNECRQNIWYFLRECVRLKVPGKPKPFMLHRGNLALVWCLINNINIFCEMPRQNGKSIAVDCVLLWLYNFGTRNSDMLIMNKAHADAKDNLQRILEMRDLLPEYLKYDKKINSTGKLTKIKDNKEAIQHHITKNRLITKPTATSPDAADKLGRGMTQPVIWFDEFAFLKYNMIIYEAVTFSNGQAAEEAKANGLPYCIIMTTTPGDMSTDEGRNANAFRLKSAKFSEDFYTQNIKDVKKYIYTNSENGFVNARFSYQQLGKGQDYFDEMHQKVAGNTLKLRREILLEWLILNENSPFDDHDIEELGNMSKEITPLKVFKLEKYYDLILYDKILADRKYIISCDVSTGSSRDNSTIVIIDTVTKKPIGVFKNSKVDTVLFSKLIYIVAKNIVKNSMVVIERNNVGSAVLSNLIRTDIANKIYHSNNLDILKMKKTKGIHMTSQDGVSKYGLWTNAERREQMYEILLHYVEMYKDRVCIPELFDEINQLIYDPKKKRIDHKQDGHDDLVMGYLIGLWVYYYDRSIRTNFKIITFPDIDPNTGLSEEEMAKLEQEKLDKEQAILERKMAKFMMSTEEYEEHQQLFNAGQTLDDLYREIEKEEDINSYNNQNASKNILRKIVGNNNDDYVDNNPNLVNLINNTKNNSGFESNGDNNGFDLINYIGGDYFD